MQIISQQQQQPPLTLIDVLASDIHRDLNKPVFQRGARFKPRRHLDRVKNTAAAAVALHCVSSGIDRERSAAVIHDTLVWGSGHGTPLQEQVSYCLQTEEHKDLDRRIHDIAREHHDLALSIAEILNDDLEHEIQVLPFVHQVLVGGCA